MHEAVVLHSLHNRLQRSLGVAFGVLTHALFAVTVWHLFHFLHGSHAAAPGGSLWSDLALAAQFTVLHSVILHPKVRSRLGRWISRSFYGCFYCVVTCTSLLLLFGFWRSSGAALWSLQGIPRGLVETAFFGSWAGLFYSLSLTGFGYQTGWTEWSNWFRRQPIPPRLFQPRGAYLWLRHPVYLSFLGLIWFTPVMTYDRAVLTSVWTVYIFVGSWLKDERLAYYIGDDYQKYREAVAGYPLIPFGPLARASGDVLPDQDPSIEEAPQRAAA